MFGKKRRRIRITSRIPRKAVNRSMPMPKSKFSSERRKNTRFSQIKKAFVKLFLISIIGLGIYSVYFSSYFMIDNIYINNESSESKIIETKIKKLIPNTIGKNLILVDLKALEIKILENFPEIENVKLKKDYPKSITIELNEFPLVANVIHESSIKKSYVINSMGYIIKEDLENTSLPYIRIKSDEPVNKDNPLIGKTHLVYILNAIKIYEEKFGMRIVEAIYKKTARETHLLTEKDFYIWLEMQNPAEDQLKKLKKILVKLDIYKENLLYIDLRIAGANGDKIIYKRK